MLEKFSNFIYNKLYPNVNNIADRLWLGNSLSPFDTDFIKANNINVIVNCTPDLPFGDLDGIKTFRISVYDSLLEKDMILMEQYFHILLPQLHNLYSNPTTNILIFCRMGKQRSAIVMAALLKTLQLALPDNQSVFQYIISKRPQAFTHGLRINFKKAYDRYFCITP